MTDDTEDAAAEAQPRKPRRRPPGLAAITALVAIAALVLAGWTTWHLTQATRAQQAQHKQDLVTIAGLEQQLASGSQQTQAGNARLANLEASLDGLQATTQRSASRIANLESGFATLSGQQQSAHDTVLLNDAEMLLRSAQQRYALFHDYDGARKAYQQAIDVLARVRNPVYAPVRAGAITERDALAAAAPPSRQKALDDLSALRSKVATLPLAAASANLVAPDKSGFWSRIGQAFSGIVTVTRQGAKGTPPTGTQFARQALSVDLAQAQEALLAFDETAYRAALQRANTTLSAEFAANAADVKAMRDTLGKLLAERPTGSAPTLGGALAQLQSLRASQPLPESTVATPTTSGATHP